jgi:hypothetical protein
MESTTRKKVTTIAMASLMALALASGSAFAGKSGGTVDNGNKLGNDNKKVSEECPSDYIETDAYLNYDKNNNDLVCYKITADGEVSVIDDTSWKWD